MSVLNKDTNLSDYLYQCGNKHKYVVVLTFRCPCAHAGCLQPRLPAQFTMQDSIDGFSMILKKRKRCRNNFITAFNANNRFYMCL